MADDGKTYFWLEEASCPRCKGCLVSDGKFVWCSFVSCEYGFDEDVLLEEI